MRNFILHRARQGGPQKNEIAAGFHKKVCASEDLHLLCTGVSGGARRAKDGWWVGGEAEERGGSRREKSSRKQKDTE